MKTSTAAPTATEHDGWAAAQVIKGATLNGELARVSERFRPLLVHLNALPPEKRQDGLDEAERLPWLRADIDDLTLAAARFNLGDPAPSAAAEPWPPLRLNMPTPAPPFPLDVLPVTVQAFCVEVSESTRAPIDFVGLACMTVAGAAIGQSVNIRAKRTWTEPPIVNAAVTGGPGKAKTPALRAARRPLDHIDTELRTESERLHKAWEEAKKAHAKDQNAPPPGPEPPQRKAIVKDITRESLSINLRDNPRGVLYASDELTGWVDSFNQYKRGGNDKQFWLSLWSAEGISVDRKGGRETVHVTYPFVSVLGGIQPDVLSSLKDDRNKNDGFVDRITFVFPDVFPSQTWSDEEVTVEAERDWEEIIRRLYSVEMKVDGEHLRPWYAILTPEAKRFFKDWFNHTGRLIDADDSDERGGVLSKSRAVLLRFALILSRMRLAGDPTQVLITPSGPPPVELEDIEASAKLMDYFEVHRERAAERMAKRGGDDGSSKLLGWIKRHKLTSFREADAAMGLRRLRDPEVMASAVAALVRAGAIRRKPETIDPSKRGPKPSPLYEVNPAIH